MVSFSSSARLFHTLVVRIRNETSQEQWEQPTSFGDTSAAGVSNIEELMAELHDIQIWKAEEQDKEVSIKVFEEPYSIPKYTVLVNSGLEFSVFVYQWPIPDEHEIYKGTNRSVRNCCVKELLKELESCSMCVGLPSVRINGVQCAICTSFWPKWRKLHITFSNDVQKKLINVSCLQINAN
jgi:hypothetical protein